jgi:DNA-binding CsgD family transcriptional regulator
MAYQNNTTWLDYVNERREQYADPALLQVEGIENLFGLSKNIHPIFRHSIPFIYMLDYTTGCYTIFSKTLRTCVGFETEYFERGGIDFTIGQYHKEDLEIYNNSIFPDRVRFLEKITPEEHAKYVFSYNFRFKNKSGHYSSVLQRNAFIRSDHHGKPLLSLGMAINVDHYKNPKTSVQLIEKVTGEDYAGDATTILKKTYFLNKEDTILTRREIEVLKWLACGLSSKLIADKLFLSEHTIIVHRKNMLIKTQSTNIAELISWAFKNEII